MFDPEQVKVFDIKMLDGWKMTMQFTEDSGVRQLWAIDGSGSAFLLVEERPNVKGE